MTQAVITCNILRTSRIDPSKSAYHQIHGERYDWNKCPMAPPGSRAVIYEDPDTRNLWESHGTDAWYCGPALDHYQCMHFYVPSTRSYRVSGSFDLFPQHCLLPEMTIDQHAEVVFTELTDTIDQLPKKSKKRMLQKLAQALA